MLFFSLNVIVAFYTAQLFIGSALSVSLSVRQKLSMVRKIYVIWQCFMDSFHKIFFKEKIVNLVALSDQEYKYRTFLIKVVLVFTTTYSLINIFFVPMSTLVLLNEIEQC